MWLMSTMAKSYTFLCFIVFVFSHTELVNCRTSKKGGCGDSDPYCLKEDNLEATMDLLCPGICYGEFKDIYFSYCDCKNRLTTPAPACVTTYLQGAVCGWADAKCNATSENDCGWKKRISQKLVKDHHIKTCYCYEKEKVAKDPCTWKAQETKLCASLKERDLMRKDYPCICKRDKIPEASPGSIKACDYTKHRPAQFQKSNRSRSSSRRKRLFSGSKVLSCQYPGVVGLFEVIPDKRAVCTASLLNEDTILIDGQCRAALSALSNSKQIFALTNSYNVKMVNEKSATVRINSFKPVNSRNAGNSLFTAKLSRKVIYNDNCAQPACIPNPRIPASYIDLNDCRVIGYGDISDTLVTGPQPNRLLEIKVKVTSNSVTHDVLKVRRRDGIRNEACLNEFSAPLVCAHKYTKEWITIGITTGIGGICSGKNIPRVAEIASLLGEVIGIHYYESLKPFHPRPDPNVLF